MYKCVLYWHFVAKTRVIWFQQQIQLLQQQLAQAQAGQQIQQQQQQQTSQVQQVQQAPAMQTIQQQVSLVLNAQKCHRIVFDTHTCANVYFYRYQLFAKNLRCYLNNLHVILRPTFCIWVLPRTWPHPRMCSVFFKNKRVLIIIRTAIFYWYYEGQDR